MPCSKLFNAIYKMMFGKVPEPLRRTKGARGNELAIFEFGWNNAAQKFKVGQESNFTRIAIHKGISRDCMWIRVCVDHVIEDAGLGGGGEGAVGTLLGFDGV